VRIVLVGTAYPLRGGIAHYIALLYRTLRGKGHRVSVLSFKRQYPSLLFPGKTQKDEGAELIPVESHPILDSINPASWIRAGLWLKQMKPDIVYFKYWMPFFAPCYAFLAFILSSFLRVPAVFLCDNVIPHEKKIADLWLTKLALRFPDSFIVQSASVLSDLRALRPDARVRLVPHPVYEIFPPPVPKAEARHRLGIRDSRVILFFGYIRDYKGLRYLLEAMPEIRDCGSVRLVVCGEFYEGRARTLDLIGRMKIEDSVTLHDQFIPNDRVGDYFCAADAVVLPYVSATQSGIVQIAYFYDRPVIATTVGGLPETVLDGRTGYLVPPENPKALAGAVLRFYGENRMDYFEKNVRIEKKKYSWDRMAEAIEELAADFHDRNSKLGTRNSEPS
jgi:glycosyltransferase involved in cell wall biosynthesis